MFKKIIISIINIVIILTIRCGIIEPERTTGSLSIKVIKQDKIDKLSKPTEILNSVKCIINKGSKEKYNDYLTDTGSSFYGQITDLSPGNDYSVLLYGKNASNDIVARGYKSEVKVISNEITEVTITWNHYTTTLISPPYGSITICNKPNFDWYDVNGAIFYELIVAQDTLFSNPVINIADLSGSSYLDTLTLSNSTYYWKIRCQDSQGNWGSWSNIFNFVIYLQDLRLISPTNGSRIYNNNFLCFDWYDVNGAILYELIVAQDTLFSNPVINIADLSVSSYVDTLVLSDGTYYWKVRAKDIAGNFSDWSKIWDFELINLLSWKYQTGGHVHSSPAIASDGTIYIGSGDDNIYALNTDGSLKWKYQASESVHSSPAIGSDGIIYFGSNDNYIYALTPNGSLKWKYQTSDIVYSSPAIGSDGIIYVGSSDNYIYALNSNGSLKWKFQTDGHVHSSPAISSDGTIYVGSGDDYIYALSTDGSFKWKYRTGDIVYSSPAIGADGTIYIGSNDNYIYALTPNGSLKWKYQTSGAVVYSGIFYSSPAIGSDGTIYVGSNDNYIYALTANGSLKWKYQASGGGCSSPAIGADGTIYVGSVDNYIYALTPNGGLKWKYQASGDVESSPAIGTDGTIYVGSVDGRFIYALKGNVLGLASSAWPKFRHDNNNTGRIN